MLCIDLRYCLLKPGSKEYDINGVGSQPPQHEVGLKSSLEMMIQRGETVGYMRRARVQQRARGRGAAAAVLAKKVAQEEKARTERDKDAHLILPWKNTTEKAATF
ncbi:hypothetical protein ACLOJK_025526 [Asimina triloba]